MYEPDFEQASTYWIRKDQTNKVLEREVLMTEIQQYLNANNTCALATGTGEFVRCTPIEYSYHDGAIWMFSEGGEKFLALKTNRNVCLAIFQPYEGFGKLKGMQVSGVAEFIEPFTEEYIKAANIRKIPIEALRRLEEEMHLIKVVPKKIEFLNSEFQKEGASSRQRIEFE